MKKRKLIKEMAGLLDRRRKLCFIASTLLLAAAAVISQITPLALGYLTDSILSMDNGGFSAAIPVLVFILAINLSNEVLKVIRRLLVEDAATSVEKKARLKATQALIQAPMSYFRTHMTGSIHGKLNRSIEGTGRLVKLCFMDFAPSIATGIAAIAVLFTALPFSVAFLSILVIPTGILIVFKQISSQRGIRVSLLESKAGMDGTMVELLGGIETIRTMDTADIELSRIGSFSEELRKKEMKHHFSMAAYDIMKFANEVFFSVLVIAFSIYLAFKGQISVGTVLTAYLCFTQLAGPLRELHRILDELSESFVLADDLFSLTSIEPDFSYLDKPDGQIKSGHAIKLDIDDFCYDENPFKKILKNISFIIPEGMYLGIAGPSGSGKSSLIKLIAKLEKGNGDILIGGRNLKGCMRFELSKIITLVPQHPFIITGTIRDNVAYGIEEGCSDDEIWSALDKANLAEFASSKPEGLDFPIAEAGENLSGGQRQRLAISRIFLRSPQILVLDEATSALDNVSEARILEEIEKLSRKGTTVIAIAHRLSTLKNTDLIMVLEDGLIAETGTFDELSAHNGIFRSMLEGKIAGDLG